MEQICIFFNEWPSPIVCKMSQDYLAMLYTNTILIESFIPRAYIIIYVHLRFCSVLLRHSMLTDLFDL